MDLPGIVVRKWLEKKRRMQLLVDKTLGDVCPFRRARWKIVDFHNRLFMVYVLCLHCRTLRKRFEKSWFLNGFLYGVPLTSGAPRW